MDNIKKLYCSHTTLTGWGRTTQSDCTVWQPGDINDTLYALSNHGNNGIIGRGCGRSYGDVSSNHFGDVVDTTSLNTIESFDPETNIVVCSAGVTIAQLTQAFLNKGVVPPVCPGTGFVTIAGAIANDVHGKNHDRHGSFGNHVEWIDLLLPSGTLIRATHKHHPELMRATIGGTGLTGIIIKSAFKMRDIGSNAVVLHEERIKDLWHFMEALRAAMDTSTYSVGWIDAVANGRKLGRGILLTAEPADKFYEVQKRKPISIPFNFPDRSLNKISVKIFNELYYRRIGRERTSIVDYERFVFPLDALLHWNRLYGSRGVYQFQCVIPFESASETIYELMKLVASSGTASPLAVLKTLGSKGIGHLSFPLPGFTLALDFPHTPQNHDMIQKMYKTVASAGGKVYLAKDACLETRLFQQMYPELQQFIQVLDTVDPDGIMQSDMSRRLSIHNGTRI